MTWDKCECNAFIELDQQDELSYPDSDASQEEILAFLKHSECCPFHRAIIKNDEEIIRALLALAYGHDEFLHNQED